MTEFPRRSAVRNQGEAPGASPRPPIRSSAARSAVSRCATCLQLAHLDHNASNNAADNLARLCQTHHWMYDAGLYPVEAIRLLQAHWQLTQGKPDHKGRMNRMLAVEGGAHTKASGRRPVAAVDAAPTANMRSVGRKARALIVGAMATKPKLEPDNAAQYSALYRGRQEGRCRCWKRVRRGVQEDRPREAGTGIVAVDGRPIVIMRSFSRRGGSDRRT